MDLLASGDLKGILDILSVLEESEKAIAEFYRTCGEIWTERQEFWLGIEREEMKHINNLQKMKDIIARKPDRFEKGRPFNIMAAQTLIKGIETNTAKVKAPEFRMANALFMARDNEQSFIESRYNEIVRTQDIEYLTLVNEIVKDTVIHKTTIDREIGSITN
ncbi:MAG: hypothetical protein PHC90_03265 [Syntrophorhabdaceae bacterium]|nr:hypothetical protein [Syntrophorhabdaceae bacterium]